MYFLNEAIEVVDNKTGSGYVHRLYKVKRLHLHDEYLGIIMHAL